MGWYLDGRVTAVVGTHTHVPTADARVLPGGTAYITDVGMTGPRGGVIGVAGSRRSSSLRTQMPCASRPPRRTRGSWACVIALLAAAAGDVDRAGAASRRTGPARATSNEPSGKNQHDVEVEPVRHAELQRDQHRGRRARRGRRGRAGAARARAPTASSDRRRLDDVLQRRRPAVEAPDRERRAARRLEADRAVVERRAGPRRAASSDDDRRRPHEADARTATARSRGAAAAAVRRQQRRERRAARTSPGRRARRPRRAPAGCVGREQRARARARATSVSLELRVQREQRERIGGPRVGERDAERRARACAGRAGTAAPTQSRSKKIAARVRRRQVVPARRSTAAPARTGRRPRSSTGP